MSGSPSSTATGSPRPPPTGRSRCCWPSATTPASSWPGSRSPTSSAARTPRRTRPGSRPCSGTSRASGRTWRRFVTPASSTPNWTASGPSTTPSRCTPASATSPPTTNTKAKVMPSAKPAATGSLRHARTASHTVEAQPLRRTSIRQPWLQETAKRKSPRVIKHRFPMRYLGRREPATEGPDHPIALACQLNLVADRVRVSTLNRGQGPVREPNVARPWMCDRACRVCHSAKQQHVLATLGGGEPRARWGAALSSGCGRENAPGYDMPLQGDSRILVMSVPRRCLMCPMRRYRSAQYTDGFPKP